jgi:hypothetical protein
VNTSAGDIVGLEDYQAPNPLCVVELQTLQHIVELGRYDAVPYLPTCQQYLQTVLHIVALGAESSENLLCIVALGADSGNKVQLTQTESALQYITNSCQVL